VGGMWEMWEKRRRNIVNAAEGKCVRNIVNAAEGKCVRNVVNVGARWEECGKCGNKCGKNVANSVRRTL
jgi:hypothetical protein